MRQWFNIFLFRITIFAFRKRMACILTHSHAPFTPCHIHVSPPHSLPSVFLSFFFSFFRSLFSLSLFFFSLFVCLSFSLFSIFTSVSRQLSSRETRTRSFSERENQFSCLNSTTPIIKLPRADSCKKEKIVRISFFPFVLCRFVIVRSDANISVKLRN